MNVLKTSIRPDASYDADFHAWSQEQAARLRRLKPADLDWENVAEEIESLGRSDKRSLGSDLRVVLEHLIIWRYQPGRRGPSWSRSVVEHRYRIEQVLADSPSLRGTPATILQKEYAVARKKALTATRLSPQMVPEACPFTVAQALDPDFWPEAEE